MQLWQMRKPQGHCHRKSTRLWQHGQVPALRRIPRRRDLIVTLGLGMGYWLKWAARRDTGITCAR